jgi:hypothetical protein
MEQDTTTLLGEREVWGGSAPFGLSQVDRRQHLYVIGRTGVGKTTLLRNIMLQDIYAGRGIAFIDPHGDESRTLLDFIPPWRIDDVVYFNPADDEFPIGLNLLQSKERPHLVASGIVGAMKSIWRHSWGPRLEYTLYATVAALLECGNVSLLGVQRMLTDKTYRLWVVNQVNDPMVRSFWESEFESYDSSFVTEAISPVLNKIGQLFMTPLVRNILGQVKSKIDARFMMDNGRIFIANLSKGRMGEDKANLLGALLVTQFQLAAMSRADTPEDDRRDFSLFADEFHSFTSDSFASILSEARKYRLSLTLSHQYVDQVPPEIRHAVFGNVGSLISFRVGQRDAEVLEKEFSGGYTAAHFTSLGNFEVCAKLLVAGEASEPFVGKTYPPFGKWYGRSETIIERSREKYGTPRHIVEGKIRRWLFER